MKEKTREFLNQIWSADWFAKVSFDHDKKSEIEINSWEDAFAHFTDEEYSDLIQAKKSEIIHAVNQQPDRSLIIKEWGQLAESCRPEISDNISNKLSRINIIPEVHKKNTTDLISWIIIHAVLQVEFSDFIYSHFYRDWCEILVSGHFACYWNGDIEQGEFIIV